MELVGEASTEDPSSIHFNLTEPLQTLPEAKLSYAHLTDRASRISVIQKEQLQADVTKEE